MLPFYCPILYSRTAKSNFLYKLLSGNGKPLLLLNVFAHDVKVTLLTCDVRGDKTNEPGCLKAHLPALLK
ncbi:MAG: hypothetical protein FWE95_11835, partial [Planctomycetaceae bacterium]|nr:hypothetical protein [Planctomycetaceae bacterium]